MGSERPILFSAPMVQAILAGRKTQTRRIVKLPQHDFPVNWIGKYEDGIGLFYNSSNDKSADVKCPYGKPGDVLWVRESFSRAYLEYGDGIKSLSHYNYKSNNDPLHNYIKWKPSIHMPKSACRIFLEIENIRVERLQDITEHDAIAEGMNERYEKDFEGLVEYDDRNKIAFEELWQKINGPDSWEANPYVWVVTFKPHTPAPETRK